MSLSYVDSGIILRTPAGMGSVMHSQAVTLLRFVPAALVLFALAIAGVINQAPILTIVSGLMTVALTIMIVRATVMRPETIVRIGAWLMTPAIARANRTSAAGTKRSSVTA